MLSHKQPSTTKAITTRNTQRLDGVTLCVRLQQYKAHKGQQQLLQKLLWLLSICLGSCIEDALHTKQQTGLTKGLCQQCLDQWMSPP